MNSVTNPTQEKILMQVRGVSDKMWGGYFDLTLTDKRIIVDYGKGLTSLLSSGIYIAGGLVGVLIAKSILDKKEISTNQEINPEDIIKSHSGNYAIKNDDVKKIKLRRKALAIGYSDMRI
jgi:hypothetical protein